MINRRTFLIGAGLAVPATWLAACSDGESQDGSAQDDAEQHGHQSQVTRLAGAELPDGAAIAPRFPDDSLVPGSIRLPISLLINDALLTNGPATMGATIADTDGTPVAEGLTAQAVEGITEMPQFWIVNAEVAQPGIYELQIDGVAEGATFQVLDRAQVDAPKPGDQLPPVDTPTVDDPRGVEPVCTRTDGICSLHTMTLTEALQLGKPIAYLIGTPAHCQFGVCAPMLEMLLEFHDELGDRVSMVHADVYTDDTATKPTKAVRAYQMGWEPSLFVADASGMIVDRLDITFGADELREVLERAGA